VLDLLLRHGPQAHRLLQAGAAIRPLTPAEAGP
jgi:hypothetical protein